MVEPRSRCVRPDERPDLPALERVTVRTWGSVTALAVMIVLVLALLLFLFMRIPMVLLVSSEPSSFGRVGLAVALGGLGIGGVLLWLGLRLLRGEFAWSTDPEGIEARGLFHRRRLRWTEIDVIRVIGVRDATDWYHFTGPEGTISFPAALFTVQLCASGWQHLRRCGRHGLLQPWDESVWDELPIEATVTRWSTDRPIPRSLWASTVVPGVVVVTLMILMAILGWVLGEGWGSLLLTLSVGGFVAGVFWIQWRGLRSCAQSCTLHDDRIEAETRNGPVHLQWDEVTRVHWRTPAENCALLVVRGSAPHQVFALPVGQKERGAVPLLFAMLARLRYSDPAHAVTLPQWLRKGVDSNDKSEAGSKERTPWVRRGHPGS